MSKSINKRKTTIPKWANRSLQGLVYYIGHELCQYNLYHLGEETIVHETVKHIQNSIQNLGLALREEMYKDFRPQRIKNMGQKRADIVLYKSDVLDCVIEVKKAESTKKKIIADITRLINVKEVYPKVRTFLIVVSQKFRPCDFVTENGYAKKVPLKVGDYYASTIRVYKATSSFKGIDSANYACLIEVHKSILESAEKHNE